jgi:hypothetical protein
MLSRLVRQQCTPFWDTAKKPDNLSTGLKTVDGVAPRGKPELVDVPFRVTQLFSRA